MQPYIPQTLPIQDINWIDLIDDIAKTNRALAKYDGYLQVIPNKELLLAPLTLKEAVLSSQIEGTQATFEEVLDYEANPTKHVSNYDDIQEVINYKNAINFAVKRLNDLPLSSRLIKEIHKILLSDVRGKNKSPGSFRSGQVFIGKSGAKIDEAIYIPPEPQNIDTYISNLEKYIHSDEKDLLVQLAIIHAQFEIIHPFWDGNGRVGRMLIPLFLFYKNVIGLPIFYISEFLENNREQYYKYLSSISQNQDWNSWIRFFLNAIYTQATNNIQKINDILNLYESYKEIVSHIPTPKNSILVLDFLFSTPIFSAKRFIADTKLQKRNVYRIIEYLQDNNIINSDEKDRNKTYYFDRLLQIIS